MCFNPNRHRVYPLLSVIVYLFVLWSCKAQPQAQSQPTAKSAYEETVQRIRVIATALGVYHVDHDGRFPVQNPEAEWNTAILQRVNYDGPITDGWGTTFKYWSDGKIYTIRSHGANKQKGVDEQGYDIDIVYHSEKNYNGGMLPPETWRE